MARKLLANLIILTGAIIASHTIFASEAKAVPLTPIITIDPNTGQFGVAVGIGTNNPSHNDRDCDEPRHRHRRNRTYRNGGYNQYPSRPSTYEYEREQQAQRQRDLDRIAYERQQREEQIRRDEARRREEFDREQRRRQQNNCDNGCYNRPEYSTTGSYHY